MINQCKYQWEKQQIYTGCFTVLQVITLGDVRKDNKKKL